jgi:subfamily B ATP-binding cassette protein MsbA
MLHLLPFMLFGLLVLRAFAGFASTFAMRWVARRVVEDLRVEAFAKLMTLPVSFFDASTSGSITSKLTYDTEQMSSASNYSLQSAPCEIA